MSGYTQTELDDIQAKWKLRFPPDLVALYREQRQVVLFDEFDWLKAPDKTIRQMLDWPADSFCFDAEYNPKSWWPEWGVLPTELEERFKIVRQKIAEAPKLIPVFGHRYIPEVPHEAGNPVFSVYQMDVIHYGANLSDYIARETQGYTCNEVWPAIKEIPFWTRAVELNSAHFAQHRSSRFFNKDGTLP